MLPFWISIALLSLAQGTLVALPRALPAPRLARLRARRWALIPAASVVLFVFVARAAEHASAEGLTYLALVGVPLLAALALGWLVRGARPLGALLVVPLFAVAWADRGGLAGQGAAVVLSVLSCVTLGVLLAAVTPPRWLAGGIVAMAVADTALVVSDLLQRPNNQLNAARPAAGLPQLQSAAFGSAVMGYGDLFVAAALGALLAIAAPRAIQLRGAALTALLALGFDLLFFAVDELPATVPVALALIALLSVGRLRLAGPASPSRDAHARRPPAATRRRRLVAR
jgi:drug/metabolite transporter superfamily protein YnfA